MIAKELIAAAAASGRHLVLSYNAGELICTCQEPFPGPDIDGGQVEVRAPAADLGDVTVGELEMLPEAYPLLEEALRRLGMRDEVLGGA